MGHKGLVIIMAEINIIFIKYPYKNIIWIHLVNDTLTTIYTVIKEEFRS